MVVVMEMRRNGIIPNVFSNNSAMGACVKGGEWRQAIDLIREMKTAGLTNAR